MKTPKTFPKAAVAAAIAAVLSSAPGAAPPRTQPSPKALAAQQAAALRQHELYAISTNRGAAIYALVAKWQPAMGQNPGWEAEFRAVLQSAADTTLLDLQSATSYDAVRAILQGKSVPATVQTSIGPQALGDQFQDLAFTPVNPPCRIFDTRNFGGGAVRPAGFQGDYAVHGAVGAQGGNAAGCTAPKGEPVGIAANFTAVPTATGHYRVFPYGGAVPTVSFLNFTAGVNIANAGIVSTCYVCGPDLSVRNYAATHQIGDVMGYFYPATFGNIDLPNSTASTGNILKNGERFIHNYGGSNIFIGENAGNFTMTGAGNVAAGRWALLNNTDGGGNVAIGGGALWTNTVGRQNVAIGDGALPLNLTGNFNVAIGVGAGHSNESGGHSIFIGKSAGSSADTGSYNIYLDNQGAGEMYTIRIGNQTQDGGDYDHLRFFAAGVRGVTTGIANAIPVLIDSKGQLGTASSSQRVKQDVASMAAASEVVMKLRPVTFRYKLHGADSPIQYGLIAEEVADVAPGLVVRSADGEVETVMYQHLTPMLLNEYQKQQRVIEAQQTRIAELERHRESQRAELTQLRDEVAQIETLKRQVARMASSLDRLARFESVAQR
jgi:Chaperone of endosialidase